MKSYRANKTTNQLCASICTFDSYPNEFDLRRELLATSHPNSFHSLCHCAYRRKTFLILCYQRGRKQKLQQLVTYYLKFYKLFNTNVIVSSQFHNYT